MKTGQLEAADPVPPATEALTISVPTAMELSPATLTPGGQFLASTSPLGEVVVTDTRTMDPGWTVSMSVTDFRNDPEAINGYNLGCLPRLIAQESTQVVTAGPDVPPAHTDSADQTPADPDLGLEASRILGWTASGAGQGTAELTADCTLVMPTTTRPGTYSAVLTITVI